jgi:hypothetical protein
MSSPASEHRPVLKRVPLWIGGGISIAAAVFAVIAAHTVFVGWGPAKSSLESGGLVVAPGCLDFGPAWETSQFHWVLPIENRHRTDVEIEDFVTSCTCSKVEPRSLSIPAGQTREVSLTINLTAGPKGNESKAGEWAFTVGIRPKIRGENPSAIREAWTLRGTVRKLLSLDQPLVDFGRQSELALPLPMRRIRVVSAIPLKGLSARMGADFLPVSVQQASEGGDEFDVTVLCPVGLPVGAVRRDIILAAQLDSGEEIIKPLPVLGQIVADVQTDPPEVLLGARFVGGVAQESLSLYSLARRPFEIVFKTVEGEGLSLEEMAPLQPGEPATFRVRQQILKEREQTGKVVFRVRPAGGREIEIVVPVSYHGVGE